MASFGISGNIFGALARPHSGRSMRISSTYRVNADGNRDPQGIPKGDDEELSNRDNFRVPGGETHTVMDVEGPGLITHIWITFLGPEKQDWAKEGSATHQEMLLRIYWDGSDRPGVEAPLGDFFAGCFGKRAEVISLPVVVTRGSAYNCFWHMPFQKSCRMEIVNQSEKMISLLYYNIDWIKLDSLPEETPYFYAQYRQEYPLQDGREYVILDTEGKGHYVGTVLAVRTRSPMWFGEGDEKISIDGEDMPSIWGTGTEDYFLSAWGLTRTNTPYYGVPYFDQWGIVGGHTSAYRWHLSDPMPFEKSFRFALETYGWISSDENPKGVTNSWNRREDDYASVAFWYQTGVPTFSARAPSGPERILPSLERVISYARDFAGPENHGDGDAVLQEMVEMYPEGPQIVYAPPSDSNAWYALPLVVEKREPLRLLVNMTLGSAYGKYQAYLDGVKIGEPMDFYGADAENKEFHLLDFWPDPGTYLLRLVCMGKRHLSEGYGLGFESVRLRERRPRVAQYGYDVDENWRADPKLYGG